MNLGVGGHLVSGGDGRYAHMESEGDLWMQYIESVSDNLREQRWVVLAGTTITSHAEVTVVPRRRVDR